MIKALSKKLAKRIPGETMLLMKPSTFTIISMQAALWPAHAEGSAVPTMTYPEHFKTEPHTNIHTLRLLDIDTDEVREKEFVQKE